MIMYKTNINAVIVRTFAQEEVSEGFATLVTLTQAVQGGIL